ncbi:hypothetical protein BJ165DRAFT_1457959 [Panaeolus papilionaceus]|nr:hypothetical protein BJ165DRAFT_1457959 [Panaeolus papilionaceus]
MWLYYDFISEESSQSQVDAPFTVFRNGSSLFNAHNGQREALLLRNQSSAMLSHAVRVSK